MLAWCPIVGVKTRQHSTHETRQEGGQRIGANLCARVTVVLASHKREGVEDLMAHAHLVERQVQACRVHFRTDADGNGGLVERL